MLEIGCSSWQSGTRSTSQMVSDNLPLCQANCSWGRIISNKCFLKSPASYNHYVTNISKEEHVDNTAGNYFGGAGRDSGIYYSGFFKETEQFCHFNYRITHYYYLWSMAGYPLHQHLTRPHHPTIICAWDSKHLHMIMPLNETYKEKGTITSTFFRPRNHKAKVNQLCIIANNWVFDVSHL